MSMTIWKFTLNLRGDTVPMPSGAIAFHVHEQAGNVCVWAYVDPTKETVRRKYTILGTGFDLPMDFDLSEYVGTAHCDEFVWHVYFKKESP